MIFTDYPNRIGQLCGFEGLAERHRSRNLSVAIARGKHLFPFRTEQLSPSAPMVLGARAPGRVGRRRDYPGGPSARAALRTTRARSSAVAEVVVHQAAWRPVVVLGVTAAGAV